MKWINNLFLKIFLYLKQIYFAFIIIKPNKFIYSNLPYFSQWESKEMVDSLLNRSKKAEDDPYWKNSGAKNKLEYLNWSWNICGMACFKMILKYDKNIDIPLISLAKKSHDYGAYKIINQHYNKGEYLQSVDGLFYKPFISFIRKEFNMVGRVVSPMVLKEILYFVSKKYYVIVSVHGSIRNPKNYPLNKGGHMVLVSGYDVKKEILYLHNPSGFYHQSQKYAQITFEDFEKFFSNRGMIIK